MALMALVLGACAKAPSPRSVIQPTRPVATSSLPSGWPYWQAPTFTLNLKAEPTRSFEDEIEPSWLASDETWHKDARPLLAKLRTQGFALRKTNRFEPGLSAFYEERARRGAPLVITADALFALSHLALTHALADIEARVERADLLSVLQRLDLRLSAEVGGARPDLLAGYRLARSTVAVALALADPSYEVPPELLDVVSLEIDRIHAHFGIAPSPLFEAKIDYGAMSARGAVEAGADDPAAPVFAAAEWLAQAPFLLEGRGEVEGAEIEVGTARTHTRAALLLARLLVPEGDVIAAAALARIDRVDLFVLGGVDDLSPFELAQMARANGLDLRGGADLVDTNKLDHLRHAASRAAALFDDSGIVRVAGDGGPAPWRPARSMRIVPLRGTPDARVLERLVFPFVGALSPAPADSAAGSLPAKRAMPNALDVATWLQSGTAKVSLGSHGDSRYAGFDLALSSTVLPSGEARHASLYSSGLDAIATWLRPSAVDVPYPQILSDARDRRKLETALAAWTLLRHDAIAFGHGRLQSSVTVPSPLGPSAAGVRQVFIEPHPEAIASLLGLINQARRGLVELGVITGNAAPLSLLDETASLLTLALEGSVRAANVEPPFADLEHDLEQIPPRIAAIERSAGPAAAPVAIDVHLDIASARVLEEATGTLDEVFLRVQDPIAHRTVIAVGASIPHFEFRQNGGTRPSDAEWAVQFTGGGAPHRDSFADVDLVAPE